jgi:5'-nucleotidase
METNIIISNPMAFEEKKEVFIKDGASKLHVLSDFDLTLTKAFVNGQRYHTVMAQVRDGNYLSPEYVKKANELFDKYHPIEIDPDIPESEKRQKMYEWWTTHFKLLVKSGLTKQVIEHIVNNRKMEFRDGSLELLALLNSHKIPLVIISSSGLGDAIPMYFKKENALYGNVHIVSNLFKFDDNGKVVGVQEPIIHVMNKNEISIKGLPFYKELLKRRNVILLGDSIGDLGMADGFPYQNLIKVGFLNENIKENLKAYKKAFDVVILNDGDMGFVVNLIREVVK